MRPILDEISLIGGLSGLILGFVMATWQPVYPEFAFYGIFFAILTLAGLILFLASRPVLSFYLSNWRQFLIYVVCVIAGVVATAAVQFVVLATGAAVPMSVMPPDAQAVFLLESAISESYFYFGIAAFFSTYLHPAVGVCIPPGLSYFMHQFIYGAMPVYIWAVVGSFAVQSILFLLTGRLSIPVGVHSVVNFI